MEGYDTSHKLLSPEEEAELIEYCQFGDQDAANSLVKHNVRMILQSVRKLQHMMGAHSVDPDDMFQEGAYGLIYAASKFKLSTGNRFSTYALNWVDQYIRRYVMNHSKCIRIPVHMYGVARRIYHLQETYKVFGYYDTVEYNKIDYDLRDAELAEAGKKPVTRITFTEATYDSISSYMRGLSINDSDYYSLDEEGEKRSFMDTTEGTLNLDDGSDARTILLDWLRENLNQRHFDVLTARYGIGREPLTLEECGHLIGVTRERCRQIQNEALKVISSKKDTLPFEVEF